MEVARGWGVVRRYWSLILLATIVAALAALASTYVVSPAYVSTASVLIRIGESRLFRATGLPSDALTVFPPKTVTDTSGSLFKTRDLAEKVVQRLHLDQPKPPGDSITQVKQSLAKALAVVVAFAKYGQYKEPTPYEAAVQGVYHSLNPVPVKESYVILLMATAPDPDLAAAIANTAAKVFVENVQAMYRDEARGNREFVEKRLERAEDELRQAQARLRDQKQADGVASLDEQIKLNAASQQEGLELLRDTTAQIEQSKTKLARARQQLDQLSDTTRSSTKMDTTTNTTSPTQSTTTASPRVTTNSNTSTSGSERSTTETTMPNPTFQAVQAELLSLEREVQSLEAKRDSLAQAIADQRGAGKSILDTEQKLSKLTLEATIASNQYVKLKTEYADALLREAREVHDIRIVDEGAPPLYPARPVKIIYVAVGLVIGLLGGTLLALALDARQRSRAGVQPSAGSTNLRPPASQPTE